MDAPDRAVEIKAAIAAIVAFLTALWGWLGWVRQHGCQAGKELVQRDCKRRPVA